MRGIVIQSWGCRSKTTDDASPVPYSTCETSELHWPAMSTLASMLYLCIGGSTPFPVGKIVAATMLACVFECFHCFQLLNIQMGPNLEI